MISSISRTSVNRVSCALRHFSDTRKAKIEAWLAEEYLNGHHPPGGKIACANRWIQSGKFFPYASDFGESLKDLNVAQLVRKGFSEFTHEAGLREITKEASKLLGNRNEILEIGSGNSNFALVCLSRGKKVTLVEPSRAAIKCLTDRIDKLKLHYHAHANLTIVNEKVENYRFPENISLIVAQTSLPYCDPSRFLELWKRMYDSLEEGGMIAAELFYKEPQPEDELLQLGKEILHRFEYGSWLISDEIANALFESVGYQLLHCKKGGDARPTIDFIAKKVGKSA